MAVAFIGDVHGDIENLEVLCDTLVRTVDRLIFLGDLIGVGRSSRSVLDFAVGLKKAYPNTQFIEGNHEAALRRYLRKGDFFEYAHSGGLATLKSYLGMAFGDVWSQMKAAFPIVHSEFLDSMQLFVEEDGWLASHAGIHPADPYSRIASVVRDGNHPALFSKKVDLPKLVVCGHYIQKQLTPHIHRDLVCLDTGCGILGGPLSALVVPSREIFQAQNGRVTRMIL